jgi:hypothetical protein
MEAHNRSVLSPTAFTGMAVLLHCTPDLSLGSAWDWKGSKYVKAQYQAANRWLPHKAQDNVHVSSK